MRKNYKTHFGEIEQILSEGNYNLLKQYIDDGHDIHTPNDAGKSILHDAVHQASFVPECYPCIELLLESGADVHQRTDGQTVLQTASSDGNTRIVQMLIDAGSEIDELDDDHHYTALMFASMNGEEDVVRFLLNAGANWKLKDKKGTTALDMYAICKCCKSEEVRILLEEAQFLETEVRPKVVHATYSLPAELSEICGDYVCVTSDRRRQLKSHHLPF